MNFTLSTFHCEVHEPPEPFEKPPKLLSSLCETFSMEPLSLVEYTISSKNQDSPKLSFSLSDMLPEIPSRTSPIAIGAAQKNYQKLSEIIKIEHF